MFFFPFLGGEFYWIGFLFIPKHTQTGREDEKKTRWLWLWRRNTPWVFCSLVSAHLISSHRASSVASYFGNENLVFRVKVIRPINITCARLSRCCGRLSGAAFDFWRERPLFILFHWRWWKWFFFTLLDCNERRGRKSQIITRRRRVTQPEDKFFF